MKNSDITKIILGISVIVAIVFVIIKVIPNSDETETLIVYCGADKAQPVVVFKNPTKAFPSFAQEYKDNISIVSQIADSLAEKASVGASLDLKRSVIELREKLNQESSRMEMVMKSNFYAFNGNPCNPQIQKEYYALLNIMAQRNSELEQLRISLTVPITKGAMVKSEFKVTDDSNLIRLSLMNFSPLINAAE